MTTNYGESSQQAMSLPVGVSEYAGSPVESSNEEIQRKERPGLCMRCFIMTSTDEGIKALYNPKIGFKHNKFKKFKSSARDGCRLCEKVCTSFENVGGDSDAYFFATSNMGKEKMRSLFDKFDSLTAFTAKGTQIVTLSALAPIASPAAKFVVNSLPEAQVSGYHVTDQARVWIEACQMGHAACPSSRDSFLPTRVIDLAAIDTTGIARLHHTYEGERGEYAALSYCWGRTHEQTVQLTTKLLDEWTVAFPIEVLPRTLHDAVKVTRELGIRYLWIDALCIIQDSVQDKEVEVQKMGKVYKNSKVTIAAATARGVSEGFLETRPLHESTLSTLLDFRCPDGTDAIISLANPIHGYRPEQPLDRRGWALQEYVLSPRLLMYGATELTWHCQTHSFKPMRKSHLSYDAFITRLPPELFVGSRAPVLNNSIERLKLQRSEEIMRSERLERFKLWTSIVTDYSGRLFTFPTDRVLAIAGIVNELSECWKDDYSNGTWKSFAIHCLGWRWNNNTMEIGPAVRSSQAPSWSWLSLDCKVDFWPHIAQAKAEVLDFQIPQKLISLESDQKDATTKLVLRSKMLSAEEVPWDDHHFWLIDWDLKDRTRIESGDKFFHLGLSNTNSDICLILNLLENGSYRRVGRGAYCSSWKWENCPQIAVVIE